MGANTFFTEVSGRNAPNARKAFYFARNKACYDYGHSGYTGSIAEKETYIECSKTIFESSEAAADFADKLIEDDDERIVDKWGPAGYVRFKERDGSIGYLFFGWAPS
jgi:hypothetical protein